VSARDGKSINSIQTQKSPGEITGAFVISGPCVFARKPCRTG
jgi:hypothetical protein